MAINLKDIKQNFFIAYSKYWIAFFLIIFIYSINNVKNFYLKTDAITDGLDKAQYVTNAVAINEDYLIASKNMIDNACVNPNISRKGKFYAFDKKNFYRVEVLQSDSISNLILLKLKVYGNKFSSFAMLQKNSTNYNINDRLYTPITLNKIANFNFKKGRLVGFRNKNFFLTFRNISKNKNLEGSPVFDKNYLLQGIIKESNANYENKRGQDEILDSTKVQKTYLVNNSDEIKKFLKSFNVDYYVIDPKTNLNNNQYKAKDSVLNIICIESEKRSNRIRLY